MRVPLVLTVLLSAAAYAPSLGDEPPPLARRPLPTPPAAKAVDAAPAAEPRVEVSAFGPSSIRVALDEPVRVAFDRQVDRASVESGFDVTPRAAGTFRWTSDRAFVWTPKRYRAGKFYSIRVAGQGTSGAEVNPARWQFRTLVPPPESITPGEGKRVVFTFDDSPGKRGRASRLLAVLRKLSVRAIFFPINSWARQHEQWVARAREDGHRVCNHTLTHRDLTKPWVTEDIIRREVENGAGHGECDLFRPPMMAYDHRVETIVRRMGYRLYLWDIDTYDWADVPKDDIVNKVLGRVRPGAVVLFHMHSESTLEALPVLAARLRDAGYVLSHEGADEDAPRPPGWWLPGEQPRR